MQPTFEQAMELINSLPASEFQKLSEWMLAKQEEQTQTAADQTDVQAEIQRFRLAMKWIDEHRAEFAGQWVCLEGDRLIAHGTDVLTVHAEARAAGIKAPFVEQVLDEPEYYLEGWEACQ